MDLNWSEKYSVNNEIIDVQHRKLFSIVNELSKAITDGYAVDIIEDILEEMSTYAWMHFRTEEDLLFKADYDALVLHRELHHQFKKSIMKVTQQVITEKSMTQVIEVHRFLYKWLNDHILEEDVQYSKIIQT
jgi:hemerythrin